MSEFAVVICGAGIAGAEGALRLRRLAGDRCQVTLVDPGEQLAYRPLAVREPFATGHVRRHPIAQLAQAAGARWVRAPLAAVDLAARTIQTGDGIELSYDALLLALGGRERPPFEYAHVFNDRNADATFHGIVQDIEMGYITSLVLIEPAEPTWPLPLYELALMTAERAGSMSMQTQITVVTPHARPLHVFGGPASDAVEQLLEEAGVTLLTGAAPQVLGPRQMVVGPGGAELRPERIVTLPAIGGPDIEGVVSAAPLGHVPIDAHCRIRGGGASAFAAGDGTDFPVKHGGIAAQQADTAAAGIAHLAGAGEAPPAVRPHLRGMLLTGRRPLYIAARLDDDGAWQSEVFDDPPWTADEKVIAEELGPYLASRDAATPRP